MYILYAGLSVTQPEKMKIDHLARSMHFSSAAKMRPREGWNAKPNELCGYRGTINKKPYK